MDRREAPMRFESSFIGSQIDVPFHYNGNLTGLKVCGFSETNIQYIWRTGLMSRQDLHRQAGLAALTREVLINFWAPFSIAKPQPLGYLLWSYQKNYIYKQRCENIDASEWWTDGEENDQSDR